MIDLKKHLSNEEDIAFVQDLYECIKCQEEVNLTYKGKFLFTFCPHGKAVLIHDGGYHELGDYQCLDDMLLKHLVDGKPFIEQIQYIDYE